MLVAEYTEEKLDYDVHIEAALVQYIAIYVVSQTHLCWKYLFSTAPVFWITGKKGPKLLALTAVAIIWCWKTILLPKVMTDIINQAPSLVSSILPNFFFFFSFLNYWCIYFELHSSLLCCWSLQLEGLIKVFVSKEPVEQGGGGCE